MKKKKKKIIVHTSPIGAILKLLPCPTSYALPYHILACIFNTADRFPPQKSSDCVLKKKSLGGGGGLISDAFTAILDESRDETPS